MASRPHVGHGVGSNGGTYAGQIGSYDTVAVRIHEFNRLGIETLMVQFQPFEPDMRAFGARSHSAGTAVGLAGSGQVVDGFVPNALAPEHHSQTSI